MRREARKEEVAEVELPPVTGYVSTGCTILDLAIADRIPGGFGVGRISHIYGPESTSKSVISLEPLGSAQRQGGTAALVDTEGTLDFKRANELFGVDVEQLEYHSAMGAKEEDLTVERLFKDIVDPFVRSIDPSVPNVLTVDSISAVSSEKEMDVNDAYGAGKAKAMSAIFRTHVWNLSQRNVTLIFVDQTRQNVGAMFNKYTFGGGEALKFYASTRVFLTVAGKIENKNKKVVGVQIHFKIEKNKIAPPFREGTYDILFDYGIDDITTNIRWLNENDTALAAGKGYVRLPFKEVADKQFRIADAVKYVEDHRLDSKLSKYVATVWAEVYAPTDRPRRVR